jgi:glyoxylase-like metal-dependent hydrolase (beta-lactamase superfamily II)
MAIRFIHGRGASALVLGLLLVAPPAHAQVVRTADATVRGMTLGDFPRVKKLAGNVYAYEDLMGPDVTGNTGFTTNSLIVVTTDGVLVADAQGNDAKTKRMIDEIAKITPQPIKYVVIAADHADHVAGNGMFASSVTFIAHPTSKATIERAAAAAAGRTGGWRNPNIQETVTDKRVLTMGGTEIQILFLGRAHTGGDLEVYLPRENILFMSETFFNRLYPSMGGNFSAFPSEWIETIRKAEAIRPAIPVPGHGFVDSPEVLKEEVVNFRRALENLVSEGQRLHKAGVPLESVPRQIDLGEFQYWYRAVNNLPDGVRKVYAEAEGREQ